MHSLKINSKNQNQVLISINILSFNDKLDIEIHPMNPKLMKCCTLNLSFVDKRTARILCEHEIAWLDIPQKEVFRLPFSGTLQNDSSEGSNFEFISKLVYSTGQMMEQTDSREYLPKIPEFLTNYVISCVPSGKLTDYPSLYKDIWNLYKEKILWDVKLKIKDTTLLAHKVILCARSSIFLAMLTGEMKEKKNGCIEIEDISINTMKKFLIFLYTNDLKELERDAVAELYYAADKYQVEQLRVLCSFHLMKTVSVDNVCKLLMLADQHNDCELRWELNDFIWKNDETVFKTSAWKELAETKPVLALKSIMWKYGEKENQQTIKLCDKISSHRKFLDDLRFLYESGIASDIVIRTKSSTFPVHKGILCASSSTFKDMFLNDAREKSTDFIEIENLEDETISKMLFLYTDSFGNIQWDTALKLYDASFKYEVYRLKFKCSCFLLKSLRLSNVCELLLLAQEHSDAHLKSAVEDYIW
ncbi:unnamed protein product [Larinioides sclopetarius]|uniref:BTB domain-containing protein n=1 Tax=Larinioides sclopetarius TaxID=280406 RepID=A0AAV2ALP6_9ARAC